MSRISRSTCSYSPFEEPLVYHQSERLLLEREAEHHNWLPRGCWAPSLYPERFRCNTQLKRLRPLGLEWPPRSKAFGITWENLAGYKWSTLPYSVKPLKSSGWWLLLESSIWYLQVLNPHWIPRKRFIRMSKRPSRCSKAAKIITLRAQPCEPFIEICLKPFRDRQWSSEYRKE